MAHAAGNFTMKSWDENTYRELDDGAKLTKATVGFAFDGDLAAEATWDAVMCYRPDGTAAYTGLQHVSGRLGDREGTFVIQADGDYADGEALSRWQVVPGSGTGGLTGITGAGTSTAKASPPGLYELDYDLG
jgi:hypothetical protein